MDFTDRAEWPDERVLSWISEIRTANHLGSWGTRHLELLEAEARHRNLKFDHLP